MSGTVIAPLPVPQSINGRNFPRNLNLNPNPNQPPKRPHQGNRPNYARSGGEGERTNHGRPEPWVDRSNYGRYGPGRPNQNGQMRGGQPIYLFVDALNYCRRLCGINSCRRWPSIQKIEKSISKFIHFSSKSNIILEIFIDSANLTAETIKKWRIRREREVKTRCREVPQSINIILGDVFKKLGVVVHYSFEADNDDTIVAHAYSKGASILSADKDMWRYGVKIPIYKDYSYRNGRLTLIRHPGIPIEKTPTSRQVIVPPPATSSICFPIKVMKAYIRGSPSPYTRDFGNIHLLTRTLRQAAYHRIGLKDPVTEKFPVWSEKEDKTIWIEDKVSPDPTLDSLLDNHVDAINHFFPTLDVKPSYADYDLWSNHVFAAKAVICEIICLATDRSLLDMLKTINYRKETQVDNYQVKVKVNNNQVNVNEHAVTVNINNDQVTVNVNNDQVSSIKDHKENIICIDLLRVGFDKLVYNEVKPVPILVGRKALPNGFY